MKNEPSQAESKTPSRPLIFLSAGEPSGDLHAARLVRELARRFPNARFVAYGGPEMEKAGCRLDVDLTRLAIMWFGRALWNLRTFIGYLTRAKRFFQDEKPDLVILVDFPGFNWEIAKRAKRAGIPVCYFMPPQLWGWGEWRVKKMKRFVDFVLCPLPFEEKWFQERGVDAVRIGHPFFEEIRTRDFGRDFVASLRPTAASAGNHPPTDGADSKKAGSENVSSPRFHSDDAGPILTLLPGSRNQEIKNNLRDMLRSARRVCEAVPNLRPMIGAFKEGQIPAIREIMKGEKVDFPVYVGRTPELMRAGDCALAVSGSVSMELLALTTPSVIYYRLHRAEHFVMRWFRRVKFITLVNLLAVDTIPGESIFYEKNVRLIPAKPSQREWSLMLFPEFLTEKNRSDDAALPLIEWLTNPESLATRRRELADLLAREDQMGDPFQNAADEIEKRFATWSR